MELKTIKKLERPQTRSEITRDPGILGGKPVIAGTRIPVRLILDHLAEGYMPQEITLEYPSLTRENIQAAIRYASKVDFRS